jgi:hypothetical protein
VISLYAIRRHLISPLSLILAFVLFVYLRLIISAGFMVDDACQAARFPLRLWDDLVAWQGTWSIRPVSWLLMPVAIHMFHGETFLFFALNSLLYLTAAFLLSSSLSIAANKFTRFFIFIGISLPIFSDSVILSPVNQLSATLSIVFFALGLQLQKKNFSRSRSLFASVFYMLSFLSYEISLGLILLIPIALMGTRKKALKSVRTFNSLLPVVTALALSLIWQKILVSALFGSSNTRLSSPDPFGVLEYLNVWLIEIPKKIFAEQEILGVLSLVCILLMWRIKRRKMSSLDTKHWVPYLILLALSPSVLYIFSGYHATSNGYLNRGLSTAWIVNVVLIAHLIQSAPYKRILLVLPCILALLLFQDRINDAIHVSNQRTLIANSVKTGISDIDSSALYNKSQPAIILADVPCTAWDSRNRLTIYCTSWDLSSELALRGYSNIDVLPLGARLQFPEYVERIYTSSNIWYMSKKDETGVNKATQISSQQAVKVLQRFEKIVSYPEDRFVKKQIRCVVENSGIGRIILGNFGLKFRTGC